MSTGQQKVHILSLDDNLIGHLLEWGVKFTLRSSDTSKYAYQCGKIYLFVKIKKENRFYFSIWHIAYHKLPVFFQNMKSYNLSYWDVPDLSYQPLILDIRHQTSDIIPLTSDTLLHQSKMFFCFSVVVFCLLAAFWFLSIYFAFFAVASTDSNLRLKSLVCTF